MPRMIVNVDRFTWPTEDGKGLHAANRGEIVDLPEAEAKRGSELRTVNHYDIGPGQRVSGEEPALIPESEAGRMGSAAQDAAKAARAKQLRAELTALENQDGGGGGDKPEPPKLGESRPSSGK